MIFCTNLPPVSLCKLVLFVASLVDTSKLPLELGLPVNDCSFAILELDTIFVEAARWAKDIYVQFRFTSICSWVNLHFLIHSSTDEFELPWFGQQILLLMDCCPVLEQELQDVQPNKCWHFIATIHQTEQND